VLLKDYIAVKIPGRRRLEAAV